MGLGLAACVPMLNPGYLERFFWGPRKRAENIETSKKKASTFFAQFEASGLNKRYLFFSSFPFKKFEDLVPPKKMAKRRTPTYKSILGFADRFTVFCSDQH